MSLCSNMPIISRLSLARLDVLSKAPEDIKQPRASTSGSGLIEPHGVPALLQVLVWQLQYGSLLGMSSAMSSTMSSVMISPMISPN